VLLGDQGHPLAHPGILDELAGLALQRGQDRADRRAHARHDGGGMSIDELGELIPVTSAERAHLDGGHLGLHDAKDNVK
jgi:hypothetical protein